MFTIILINVYLCLFFFILGLIPVEWENRPTLSALGIKPKTAKKNKNLFSLVKIIAKLNKPICQGATRKRIEKDLAVAHINITPEEFILAKELCIMLVLFCTFPIVSPDLMMFWVFISLGIGFILPEFILKGKIKKVKAVIVKELPDAIDLLGLCVNAGLDFMLSLKWVVEKSPPSVMIDELNVVLQEINVGKTRRDAIKDLAARYELPDLSTFSRTLIQADKMGTSVTEALNILSEDMRQARYRRGEQLALKAPMKMLVPLLVFIFPVVGILVAGPIILDFIESNPLQGMTGG
ncbi:MAG: type II secretion system F family protein [Candidatus Omnitrophica bacterium]|nr:type II secretion system F family protein [Candidatus Omnitrophota bacterium]